MANAVKTTDTMRKANRGDVPMTHAPPGQAKNAPDPADDVVFDAGSLSFVQEWVVDGGANSGGGGEAAAEIEPEREDPRQSNPNRRLGVGAQPKKPKQERVSLVCCCAVGAETNRGRSTSAVVTAATSSSSGSTACVGSQHFPNRHLSRIS